MPDFHVLGSAHDPQRFPRIIPGPIDSAGAGPSGTREIRLWSREWNHTWTVDVDLPAGKHSAGADADNDIAVKGRVVCLWSDANQVGTIPALDEVKRYEPVWAGVTKLGDGLVEASKGFEILRSGSGSGSA